MRVGDELCDPVSLNLREIPGIAGHDSYWLEAGEKMVRVWDGPVREEGSEVLNWFTTEKLLFDRAHEMPGIDGLPRSRDMATYDLLYVGIARKGDSFDRLIARGHKARMDILANEPQRYPGARVTDEIYLFFFRVNPLVIQTFDLEHEFTGDEFSGELDQKRIVADAENGESIAFNTAHGRIKGACDPRGSISNDADFIFVEGDKVSFLISGVDFPGSAAPGNVE